MTISLRTIAKNIGAEIDGVDLSETLSGQVVEAVREALLKHQVVFFRDQKLTPNEQLAFARRFDRVTVHPAGKGMPGHPEILEVIKEPWETENFGGGWHSDSSFMRRPPSCTLLYAIEVPDCGGDTMFASQYAAWESLSEGLQKTLQNLTAIHSAGVGIAHPVVRTHPDTKRKCLYVNPAFTLRFKGWTRKESRPLLEHLFEVSQAEAFTCRFRWTPGSVALWDNRCVWHRALNDYHGKRRHMRRVTLGAEEVS